MNGDEIRRIFLDFFTSRGHELIAGASLIPDNDPTLLFINSGMAPLKRYFTGEARPSSPDLCNVQPCLRTTDIEDVGDRHHLTFFEMLGSWSIGNYFKERAISLAFDLLTSGFGYTPDRLYATVFAGDPERALAPDEMSAGIWESVGLRRDHIVPLGMDNFWGPAGDTGPCGPCTEVFFDTGDAYGPRYEPGGHFDTDRRYIEIWNAGVFMEFNKDAQGRLTSLPFRSVDTGSGLERMAMVLGGHETVYDTDLLKPIGDRIHEVADLPTEAGRLLADHVRAATMILAEGVRPSNLGRGYIPRRLVRKCVEVVTRAGMANFPFPVVIDAVIERFGHAYPQLVARSGAIKDGFDHERAEFAGVVERGIDHLERLRARGELRISGQEAFSLFATYGMPVELVRDYARGHGGDVDMNGFNQAFREHQARSRAASTQAGGAEPQWSSGLAHVDELLAGTAPAPFVGYERTESEANVTLLLVDGKRSELAEVGSIVEVVLDRTPFYPEGGGQVGDGGVLETADGAVDVSDTRRSPSGHIVHRGHVVGARVAIGAAVRARVDADRRIRTAANHSATHLLQAALRRTLGNDVRQAGSLVEPGRLRFDFTYHQAVGRGRLTEIERLVNDQVLADLEVRTDVMAYEEAVASGALMIPGETYGAEVRVVRMGTFSAELCGGTHLSRTSQVGLFRLVSESSIAAGVRRVVAVTRDAALDVVAEQDRVLAELAGQLGVGTEGLPQRVRSLIEGSRRVRHTAEESVAVPTVTVRDATDGTRFVTAWHRGDAGALRGAAFDLAQRHEAVTFLATRDGDTARVTVVVPDALRGRHDAAAILKEVAPLIQGSGGGNRRLAQGGGGNPDAVEGVMRDFGSLLVRASAQPGRTSVS